MPTEIFYVPAESSLLITKASNDLFAHNILSLASRRKRTPERR
jgi:hypothetical protein